MKNTLLSSLFLLYLIFSFNLRLVNGQVFSEVADQYGLADTNNATSAVWFDYDLDGDLDIYVSANNGRYALLFRFDGGMFKNIADTVAISVGHATSGMRLCVGDYDNDGDIDISSPTDGISSNSNLFRNDLDNNIFTGVGRYGFCGIMADFDNDGDLDLYSPNQDYDLQSPRK